MSCMTEEEIMEDLKSLENTMIEQIPDEINSNFKLNISDTYQVTYTLFDQVNEGEFVYESPFFDKKGMFKISISKNNSTLDIEKEVTLVALDSGRG